MTPNTLFLGNLLALFTVMGEYDFEGQILLLVGCMNKKKREKVLSVHYAKK